MSHGARWVAAGASLALACSLVTSLDDLKRDNGPCATCVDGSAPVDASTDAKIEAAAPSDSATGDVGADVAIDAAARPFCASLSPAPKLCEDFDIGLFSAQFPNVHTSVGGTLATDSMAFRSPTKALLASLPVANTNVDDAYMTRVFTGASATNVSCSFDLRIDSWVTGGKSAIAAGILVNDSTPSQHALSFYVTETSAAVEEVFVNSGGTTVFLDHQFSAHPTLGVWTRVTFDVDLMNHTCSASLDGVPVLTNVAIDASWSVGEPAIDLGMTYVGDQTSAWALRYDNVVVDWK